MGILQARILKWVAVSFSRGSYQPRDWTQVSCIAGRFFTMWATREALSKGEGRGYLSKGTLVCRHLWLSRPGVGRSYWQLAGRERSEMLLNTQQCTSQLRNKEFFTVTSKMKSSVLIGLFFKAPICEFIYILINSKKKIRKYSMTFQTPQSDAPEKTWGRDTDGVLVPLCCRSQSRGAGRKHRK